MYQLLFHRKFPFKTEKILVAGPSNCGKTSWFSPFYGIIDREGIATFTREGKFAAHLLSEDTEVIFIDEWSSGICCVIYIEHFV